MKEVKQLKEQYQLSVKTKSTWFGQFDHHFIYRRDNICRSFSTKQEKSYALLHETEYKCYGLKVRNKRGGNLPSDWEDLPSFVYRGERDWKRNSKRKHQYFRVKNM